MANYNNSYRFTNGYGTYTIGFSLDYIQNEETNATIITHVVQTIINHNPNLSWPYGTIDSEVSIDQFIDGTWQRKYTYPLSQTINLNNSVERVLLDTNRLDSLEHDQEGNCKIRVNYKTNMVGVSSGPTGESSYIIDLPQISRASILEEISNFVIDSEEGVGQAFQLPLKKSVASYYDVLEIKLENVVLKTIDPYVARDRTSGV